jgi:hypothetical protein
LRRQDRRHQQFKRVRVVQRTPSHPGTHASACE